MSESQVLNGQEVIDILSLAVSEGSPGTISYLAKGKWHISEILHATITGETVHVELAPSERTHNVAIQINQPVGIAIQHGFNKFIYEAAVVGFESSVNQTGTGKIVLEMPEKVEKMQRREYVRIDVPADLTVKVLFWHRGYLDGTAEVPHENYWQGRLVNLSAGGFQIEVDRRDGPNFRSGQLVGLQFTPMCYEQPVVAEAQIKHVAENAENGQVYIGAEFIGLEASSQGRRKLRRIADIVSNYQKQNSEHTEVATAAGN
ncbi:MAG: PilZ domain-containing protein [Planctomycetes bacterium]|nr:PilZ domain-containing protein [Planctomycetota bacterium]